MTIENMKTYISPMVKFVLTEEDIVTASAIVTGKIGDTVTDKNDIGAPDRRRSIWN